MKSIHATVLVALCLLAGLGLWAGTARAEIIEGRDYTTLDPPQRTLSPGKIEVEEFFSYGNPRCNELRPLLRNWAQKLPRDVILKRLATGFGRAAWTSLAKTFYALEATGALNESVDDAIFLAIHQEHRPLFDQKQITAFMKEQHVDIERFTASFGSFGVGSQLNQAEQMVESYKIEQIPAVVVNGKYLVRGRSYEEVLRHATELIIRERANSKSAESGGT